MKKPKRKKPEPKFKVGEYRALRPNSEIKTWLVLGFLFGCFGEDDMKKLANLLYELGWFVRSPKQEIGPRRNRG